MPDAHVSPKFLANSADAHENVATLDIYFTHSCFDAQSIVSSSIKALFVARPSIYNERIEQSATLTQIVDDFQPRLLRLFFAPRTVQDVQQQWQFRREQIALLSQFRY